MQDLLTIAINVISVGSIALLGVAFLTTLAQPRKIQVQPETEIQVQTETIILDEIQTHQPAIAIAETAPSPELKALSPEELRKLCQRSGIVWRNAHGKNKHLRKHEMIEALSA